MQDDVAVSGNDGDSRQKIASFEEPIWTVDVITLDRFCNKLQATKENPLYSALYPGACFLAASLRICFGDLLLVHSLNLPRVSSGVTRPNVTTTVIISPTCN